jgi:thymidylate synthase
MLYVHWWFPCRQWSKTLPYAESLWIASGRNDLDYITRYLIRMRDFSDDQIFARGAYGPRLRHFNGSKTDYKVTETVDASSTEIDVGCIVEINGILISKETTNERTAFQ